MPYWWRAGAAVHLHSRTDVATALAKLAIPHPNARTWRRRPDHHRAPQPAHHPTHTGPGDALWLAGLVVIVPILGELLALTTPLLHVAGTPVCPIT